MMYNNPSFATALFVGSLYCIHSQTEPLYRIKLSCAGSPSSFYDYPYIKLIFVVYFSHRLVSA